MRQLVIAALFVGTASAQTVVQPADIPAAEKRLESHEGEKILRCDVDHSKAALNFGLRLQASYLLQVPLVQYTGPGHAWNILLKVTPEGVGEQPVYLADYLQLPEGMHPEYVGETSGSFVLGEGRYSVKFLAYDDRDRVCRREWQIDAGAGRSGRAIKVAMPPNTVADLSYSAPASEAPADSAAPRRLTVLMNGSAPYQSWLHAYYHPDVISPYNDTPEFYDYRAALLGILSSLLEKFPGTSVRLVVFDLDQQKETLRQDGFTLKDMDKAAHAANDTDHWVVTVSELQNRPGRLGLLASLIERETDASEKSDLVLFLGPQIASSGNMPPHFLDSEKGAQGRFLYLQYHLSPNGVFFAAPPEMSPNPLGIQGIGMANIPPPEPPDLIELAVARLKGKTLGVHSPVDFAKAVDAIRRRPVKGAD
jgi:hypothetical protein